MQELDSDEIQVCVEVLTVAVIEYSQCHFLLLGDAVLLLLLLLLLCLIYLVSNGVAIFLVATPIATLWIESCKVFTQSCIHHIHCIHCRDHYTVTSYMVIDEQCCMVGHIHQYDVSLQHLDLLLGDSVFRLI